MSSVKLSWNGTKDVLERVSVSISELYDPPADAVGLTRVNGDDEPEKWCLEAYFSEGLNRAALNDFLSRECDFHEDAVEEELPDIDWVAHALSGLGVVRCGRFVLYGIHDADKLPNEASDIPIRIDANQAFGTGHHPTTAGCLTLLDRFAGFAPKNILDLGCGSAILSIAAAKLWGRKILATDIDEKSVEIAQENARLNDVGENVLAITADGFDDARIDAAGPFDFVFANILAGPLGEFAPAMAAHVKKNGRIMLAGFMSEQEEKLCDTYAQNGFRIINRLDDETWPVMLLVRT